MSGLKIWYSDRRLGDDYVPITFDELALHVHEMAAVAWDRDSPEILSGQDTGEDLRVCGKVQGETVRFSLHTQYGQSTCIAIWDEDNIRWRGIRMNATEVGDRLAQKARPNLKNWK